jgi:hypothetical protein
MGKSTQYPVNRRLGGSQSWYGHFGKEQNSPLLENKPHFFGCPVEVLFTTTQPSQPLYNDQGVFIN